ncbi:peroxidase-like [Chironomus tepperi]|uniref:peroxidase-like n=1 Tax=Chironomus tepperi TaxID=113505 RepID=UPI00391F105A
MKRFLVWLVLIFLLLEENKILANVRKEFCESISLPIKCDKTLKYRQINGRCNNLINPYLGAANTRLSRLLRSRYSDDISAPPKSVKGGDLPSARLISLTAFSDNNVPNVKFTQAFMQYAQVIAHDVTNVLGAPSQRGCCKDNGLLVPKPDKSCLHIPVPRTDNIHSGMTCLDFTRSLSDNEVQCPNYPKGYPSEQINGATSNLDLSHVYGVSQENLKSLRSFKGGQLAVESRYNTTWPLQEPNASQQCFVQTPRETCYRSGDSRLNQNPELTIVHILFIREHNRIAKELQKVNPKWSDEILFQEARRINIAQFQYITYYGWLTAVVGGNNLKAMGFYYQPSGSEYANDYDPKIDSSVYNEFSAGSFRLLHSLIDGHLRKLSESRTIEEIVRLSETFLRPKFIEGHGSFDSFLRGMVAQPSQSFDKNYDAEIRSYLFKRRKVYGSDLNALDIQRGRDHGLGSYNDLRNFCGIKRAVKWEDFADYISVADIDNLKKVYADVDDVDLNVGSSLEKPYAPGIAVGVTYICILRIQIRAFRSGDRYWFETKDPAIRFTPNQLAEIRKASFSRIICDNTETIFSVPQNPFLIPNDVNNTYVKCSDLPKVDLSLFKE